MRPVINSGWTVFALLLAGTYLLGFAGTALATDPVPVGEPAWPDGTGKTVVPNSVCNGLGTPISPANCANGYSSISCTDRHIDPNPDFTACPDYRWVKIRHKRYYGFCGSSNSQATCDQYAQFPCAQFRIWKYEDDCTFGTNNEYCDCWVWVANGCRP